MRYGIEEFPFHRRAGACPPPCCGLPKPREGQALALRYRDGDWGHPTIARDRPSRYGIEEFPFHRRAGACPPPCFGAMNDREGQALALRYRRFSVYRRAGACPPPCCDLPKPREGQALALRCGEGGWGDRTLARDRPSRYGVGTVVGAPDAREGQALALRYAEGGWDDRMIARDRPSRYGMGGNPSIISTVFKLTVITEPMSSTIAADDSESFGSLTI